MKGEKSGEKHFIQGNFLFFLKKKKITCISQFKYQENKIKETLQK